MPKYTRQGQGSLHRGQAAVAGEGRYSNTKATVNTTPWVGLGTGRKSKQSQVASALGSRSLWEREAGFGQLGESL